MWGGWKELQRNDLNTELEGVVTEGLMKAADRQKDTYTEIQKERGGKLKKRRWGRTI